MKANKMIGIQSSRKKKLKKWRANRKKDRETKKNLSSKSKKRKTRTRWTKMISAKKSFSREKKM